MPRIALIVCTAARSGSVLLATALKSTRLAGRPEEYFGRTGWATYAERFGVETDADYLAAVLAHGTTPNGVFGATVHRHHLEGARGCLEAACGRELPDDPFSVLAPRVQYVWLRRRDRLRQALSEFRARRTGVYGWLAGTPHPDPGGVSFDYDEIRRLLRRCERWDAGWRDFFARLGAAPAELVYEDDLEPDYQATVRRLLGLLEVEAPPDLAITSTLQKQSDSLTEELRVRYLEEEARRGDRR